MTNLARIRLIARREVRERVRARSYRVSVLLMLGIVLAAVVIFSLAGGDDTKSYDVGIVGAQQPSVLVKARAQQDAIDVKLKPKSYASETALRSAVSDKKVDVGLTGSAVLARSNSPTAAVSLLQSASQTGRPSVAIQRVGKKSDDGSGIAFVGTLLLYISLLSFGYVLTAGIVEEKSSRVVEILLTSSRPIQLLAGKVIGVGLVGLAQMLSVVVVGFAAAKALGKIDLPDATVGGGLLVLLFFVLGYLFYAFAFAATSSLVSRQEDIQSTTMPVTLVLVVGYILSINVSSNADSALAKVCVYLPPFAPMMTPNLALQGELGIVPLIGSVVLMVLGIGVMLWIAARIYEHSIMWTGAPVSYRGAIARLSRGGGAAAAGTAVVSDSS